MKNTDSILHEIRRERGSQIQKGYTAEHDDKHSGGELAQAAGIVAADLEVTDMEPLDTPRHWAAHIFEKHQHNRRHQLIIATAMLVAEIERMDREAGGSFHDNETCVTCGQDAEECSCEPDSGLGEDCEGCGQPATTRDSDDIPLCQACWDALPLVDEDGSHAG